MSGGNALLLTLTVGDWRDHPVLGESFAAHKTVHTRISITAAELEAGGAQGLAVQKLHELARELIPHWRNT